MDATFAALMNKAKANTQAQTGILAAKQAELQATREREARLEKEFAAKEREKRQKEVEARERREKERHAFEERLRGERERKRAEKQVEEDAEAARAKGKAAVPKATKSQPLASTSTTREVPVISSIARKKKRQIDALFSDDDMSSDASAARRSASKAKSNRVAGITGANRSRNGIALSAKDRLRAEFDPSELRSLNENKRDVRTIEEIEQDLHRKQQAAKAESQASTSKGMFAARKTHDTAAQSRSKAEMLPKASTSAGPSRSVQDAARKSAKEADSAPRVIKKSTSPVSKSNAQRARSHSDSPPRPLRDKASKAMSRRDEIWAILNPHKAAPAYRNGRVDHSDDDMSDDMEAGIDDIEEEDRETARIARLEDKREEARLQQRAKEKADKKRLKG